MDDLFRKSAPQGLAPIAFSIPRAFETSLDNGLQVIVFPDNRLPIVSYRLSFDLGDIDDPPSGIGEVSAVASMLTEGAADYSSRQLAEKIERLGASLSASASDDFTIVAASALSLYRSEVLRLLADVVLRPTFPENELDLYRRNSVEHLTFQRSQPGFLAGEQAARLVYGSHPYAVVSPSAADVLALDREKLIDLHSKRFVPGAAKLIVVGDVQTDTLLGEIQELFGSWEGQKAEARTIPAVDERRGRLLCLVDRPGSAQSNIVITNLAAPRRNPDYFPLIVMNQILGAGASSRVFMNLREEKGYTYGAYTRLDMKQLAGDFDATAEVRTAVTGDSLKEFFFELERIRSERVSDAELQDAKSFLTGVFPLRAETQEGLTNLIVNQYAYELPQDYLETYRSNVEAVSADDVLRVAKEFVRPDEAAIVIVGDAGEILPQVQGYASEVEIYDTEKNPIDPKGYDAGASDELVDVSGNWKLNIDFQGQSIPLSLVLSQDADKVSGTIKTSLGNGTIDEGAVVAGQVVAKAQAEIQGQPMEFSISGRVRGNAMSGTVVLPIVPDPLPFTGSRD